jgi:uncharacterized protein (TIGR03382 family)
MNPNHEKAAATPAADTPAEAEQATRRPEEIEAEIEATREELGETVSALGEKTDVKGQAQRKLDESKAQAQAKLGRASETAKDLAADAPQTVRENPIPLAIAAGLGGLVALAWLRRRRR